MKRKPGRAPRREASGAGGRQGRGSPRIGVARHGQALATRDSTALKGVLLAGGSGSRLGAVTAAVSKQLLPIYDKPMVFYPLSTLMLAGIRDILVISTPDHVAAYERLLGDGARIGIRLSYAVQTRPRGIADALLVAKRFVGTSHFALALGDNVFFGHGLPDALQAVARNRPDAAIFAYYVRDPSHYGVVEFDSGGKAVSLEEKPEKPRSSFAVPGLYFFSPEAVAIAEALKPSARGELEITDVNREFLRRGRLTVTRLGRGIAWLDTGTPHGLLEAAQFIAAVQNRQGLRVACLEEVAYAMGFISRQELGELARAAATEADRAYLTELVEQGR